MAIPWPVHTRPQNESTSAYVVLPAPLLARIACFHQVQKRADEQRLCLQE